MSTTVAARSSLASFFLAMNVIPTNRLVPLGGVANFTIALYNGGDLSGNYSLSAAAPSGLSFDFQAPVNVTGGGPHAGHVIVQSLKGMQPGTYNVTLFATGSGGVANQTFAFYVQRNLVLLTSYVDISFSNITLKAGDTITWVSLDGPLSDEFNANHKVFLSSAPLNINTTSGELDQYGSWSYTFSKPGTYRWSDWALANVTGEVIVTP